MGQEEELLRIAKKLEKMVARKKTVRPRSARAAYPGWRCKQSDFGFASPRPRQNLGEPWKREGVRPAPAVFGGRPGGVLHCLTLFAEHSFLKSYKLT